MTTHISFLLKSSTFGRPGLGRSPLLQMAFSQIPALLWEFIFGRPSVGKSTPPLKGNFTDSCSDCPQFFPTLRAQHLAGQGLEDLPTLSNINFRNSCPTLSSSYLADEVLRRSTPISNGNFDKFPALTAHISFLLWELNIWQTRSWQIYPPFKWHFHRFLLWLLIFLTYSESSTFGRPGLVRSTPLQMSNFTDSCSTLRVHIWQTNCWEIYPTSNGNLTDSCSDCSYFFPTLRAQHLADQVSWQIYPLSQIAISQIPALTAHISFLHSELNIWQTRSWQIYPPSNGIFTDSCSTLKA